MADPFEQLVEFATRVLLHLEQQERGYLNELEKRRDQRLRVKQALTVLSYQQKNPRRFCLKCGTGYKSTTHKNQCKLRLVI